MRQIDLDVDTSSLALEQKQDVWSGALDVVFAQLDGVGNVVGSIGRLVSIRLNAAERERLLSDGLVLNAPLEIQPKCAQVRIIIRDATSGAIGTVTATIR